MPDSYFFWRPELLLEGIPDPYAEMAHPQGADDEPVLHAAAIATAERPQYRGKDWGALTCGFPDDGVDAGAFSIHLPTGVNLAAILTKGQPFDPAFDMDDATWITSPAAKAHKRRGKRRGTFDPCVFVGESMPDAVMRAYLKRRPRTEAHA